MSSAALQNSCKRASSSLSRSTVASTSRLGEGSCSATQYQCRKISDQKSFKGGYDADKRRQILDELGVPHDKEGAVPSELRPIFKKTVPRFIQDFAGNQYSKALRRRSRDEDDGMQPFEQFKNNISPATYEAITVKPFRHTHATPIQARVLELLPDLAKPYSEDEDMSSRSDILALSSRGTGKSLAFLLPAIEARREALTAHGKNEVLKAGVISNASLETQAMRTFAKTRVGTLVITPTREEATTIANEAILLSRNQAQMEVRLFVGGLSKKHQLRDWMKDRRDIVVATAGRLRDLLAAEAIVREGFEHTSLLVLDQADQLLEDGFRDDIDAIIEFLPKGPERQTFIFADHMTHAVKQLASRVLKPDHLTINVATELKSQHSDTSQYHTVLPNASYQIPYLMKLIAHDQMVKPGKSKVVVYVPTTRMCQLFTTLVQELSKTCLPAGENTNVYSIHSMLPLVERSGAVAGFSDDRSGSSVLVTTDISSRQVEFPQVSRVIQLGIPSSDPVYFQRLGHAARSFGPDARGDLVLLPWEIGYLTWQLMEVPFKPLTVTELDTEIQTMARDMEKAFQNQDESAKPKRQPSNWAQSLLTPLVTGIDQEVSKLLPRLDEDSIRETFVSILGYYIPKSGEIRTQKSIIVQGAKDWTTEACGLPSAPFVSDTFLIRLGIMDGRTKRFGWSAEQSMRRLNTAAEAASTNSHHWMGRGRLKRETKGQALWGNSQKLQLDERDPQTVPESYRTNLYGRPDPTIEPNDPTPERRMHHHDPDRLAREGWDTPR